MINITVGLCKGRHAMPVDEFIFDRIDNVNNYAAMGEVVRDFLMPLIYDHKDEDITLTVYVTGLTAAMLATVHEVAKLNAKGYKIHLDALNYDMIAGNYNRQSVL